MEGELHVSSGRECHNLCKDHKQNQNQMAHRHHKRINCCVFEDCPDDIRHSILGLRAYRVVDNHGEYREICVH